MANRIDHGLLVMTHESDGTTTLTVCDSIVKGRPHSVSAQYRHAAKVRIDQSVELNRTGDVSTTAHVVEVDGRTADTVTVRRIG